MTLPDLLHRLETEEPSRELDTDLWFDQFWEGQGDERIAPPLTSSLDAAVALVEASFPEATIVIRKSGPTYWLAGDIPIGQWGAILNDNPLGWTVAKTGAQAICATLVRAIINQGEE